MLKTSSLYFFIYETNPHDINSHFNCIRMFCLSPDRWNGCTFRYLSDLLVSDIDEELRHCITVVAKISLCRESYCRMFRAQKETQKESSQKEQLLVQCQGNVCKKGKIFVFPSYMCVLFRRQGGSGSDYILSVTRNK